MNSPGAQLLVDFMRHAGIPLTRENWLDLDYGSSRPEELTPEADDDLPDELRMTLDFDPNEARDPEGKWTSGGGTGKGSATELGHGYSAGAKLVNGVVRTDNPEDAVRALYEGRVVDLNQPREIATMLDHLGQVAKHMVGMGGKAPNFNLCNVSVEGTNLFCTQSKGIPRIKMPQLPEGGVAPFKAYLEGKGVKVEYGTEDPAYLRATQNELIGVKVAAIAQGIKDKDPESFEPLVVSRDNYIVDGHHRWAAQVGVEAMKDSWGGKMKLRVARVDMPILDLLKEADAWTGGAGHKGATAKDGFDPSEPRDPAGKWTAAAGGAPSDIKSPALQRAYAEIAEQAKRSVRTMTTGEQKEFDKQRRARIRSLVAPSVTAAMAKPDKPAPASPESERKVAEYADIINEYRKVNNEIAATPNNLTAVEVEAKQRRSAELHSKIAAGRENDPDLFEAATAVAKSERLPRPNLTNFALYHGTAEENANAILTHGLVPHGGVGGDAWAAKHMSEKLSRYSVGERAQSVYVTPDLHDAEFFAKIAAQVHPGSEATVLKVTIPPDQSDKLRYDELAVGGPFADKNLLRFVGSIPPEWISRVETRPPNTLPAHLTPGEEIAATDAGAPTTVYIVALADPNAKEE